MISIRRAQANDKSFLTAMVVEAVNWDPGQVSLSAEAVAADPSLDRYVAGWPRGSDLGVVAEADGVQVGAAWLRMFDPRAPGYGFIAEGTPELSIGVLPDWRGRGVGGRLMDELLQLARAERIQTISLSVAAANPARRLYERRGFVLVSESGDSITMRLDLSPRS